MGPGRIAIGTWSGGRFMHFGEPLSDERLRALLRPGDGIDTVITADAYGAGEAIAARRCAAGLRARELLPDRRDRARLLRGPARGRQGISALHRPTLRSESAYGDYIRAATERSLQRCGVERFDVLLLHNPDHTGYLSETVWQGMQAARCRPRGRARRRARAGQRLHAGPDRVPGALRRLIDWAMIILSRWSRGPESSCSTPPPRRSRGDHAGRRLRGIFTAT